jgi:NAD(P)H-dependent FMN reductase
MSKNPKILAFAGSLREKSYNKQVLKVAMEGANSAGAVVTPGEMTDVTMREILQDLGKSLADTLRKTHGEIKAVKSDASNIISKQ